MNDADRLDEISEVLFRLSQLASDHVILVEGHKDVAALESIGISGDICCVQVVGGAVRASEYVWKAGKKAVILTDWDRRGGILAHDLRENLSTLGVEYDDIIRRDLAALTRPFAKDVESLDSVLALLKRRTSKE